MITVWKYNLDYAFSTLNPDPSFVVITVPQGAVPLHVDRDPAQGNYPEAVRVWFQVDTDKPMVPITLRVVGTGHPLSGKYVEHKHLGSVVISIYAWHVYQVLAKDPQPALKAPTTKSVGDWVA